MHFDVMGVLFNFPHHRQGLPVLASYVLEVEFADQLERLKLDIHL
jgi:hypothetical protein